MAVEGDELRVFAAVRFNHEIVGWVGVGRRLGTVAEGISNASLVLAIAAAAGIIDKSGAWYSSGTQRIGQGRENAKMCLKDNAALMAEVEEKGKGVLGIGADQPPGTPDAEADADA